MHRLEAVCVGGETVRFECRCGYCDALRAVEPRLDAILADLADPVRPDPEQPEGGRPCP